MKKRLILGIMLFLLSFTVYSQTWTVYGDEDVDVEYTVISEEQFDRIIRENETKDANVTLHFIDFCGESYIKAEKIIKGSRPGLYGHYYLTSKFVPKTEIAKFIVGLGGNVIMYGNTKTGAMVLTFIPGSDIPPWSKAIILRNNWNEYVRQYNQLKKTVDGEK